MSNRVTLQEAFVIHTRYYSDTSLLVEFFTLDYGRLTLIAKGARNQRSKLKGLLLPFVPLLVSWSGKSSLPVLTKLEPNGNAHFLSNKNLLYGLYINELLMRLIPKNDPQQKIYYVYKEALNKLSNESDIQLILRVFEKQLIANIGYGVKLDIDINGQSIESSANYEYKFGVGFTKLTSFVSNRGDVFSGASLTALHENKLTSDVEYKDAKRLMRFILNTILENRPIKSRELFIA